MGCSAGINSNHENILDNTFHLYNAHVLDERLVLNPRIHHLSTMNIIFLSETKELYATFLEIMVILGVTVPSYQSSFPYHTESWKRCV